MPDKPASPFASLGTDKALLRSTKPQETPPPTPTATSQAPEEAPAPTPTEPFTKPAPRTVTKPRSQRNISESVTPLNHDTVVSRYHDTTIETIRRAVRVVGKEAATYRFSPEEKARMADLIYTYKRQGVRTSENEVSRIALNFIFADYEENGEASILAKALDALNR